MQLFGLIGNPLTHSFSKDYFTAKFSKEGIENTAYELFQLNNITELNDIIKAYRNLRGINVTIPYKETVLPYLHEIDSTAKAIKAVNTIKLSHYKNGKTRLIGFNTDVIGFKESLKPFLAKQHDRALILGTGGSSKAVAYVLKELNIPYYFVSRNPKSEQEVNYTDIDKSGINAFKLIVNCTPLGMHPNINEIPSIPIDGIGQNHLIYDLVYNPKETLLLKESKKRGANIINGLSMLKLQAEASWRIWNKKENNIQNI